MVKREKAITSTISNLITSYLTLVLGLVIGIIINRSLGPELKGEYANLKLIISFYAPFLSFGYQAGILYYGVKKEIDLQRFFWSGWLIVSVLGILVIPSLIPFIQNGYLGKSVLNTSDLNVFLGLTAVPLVLLNGYSERVIRSYHMFKATNYRIIAGTVTTLLYYLIVFFFFKLDLKHALIGNLIGQVTQLVMNLYFVIRHIEIKWSLTTKQLFKPWNYGIKGWLNRIISKSNDKFDQIVLTFLLNASSFGVYTVGVGLSNMVTKIPASYVNVFYNQIAEKAKEEAIVLYAKAQRITFLITTIIALGLAIVAYPLIYLLYGEAFIEGAWVVAFYTPGLIFQVGARLSVKFYAGIGKPLKNSLVYLTGIVVSLPFYFFLIPIYGIKGAAISSSIAYFAAFMFSYYQIYREFKLPLTSIFIFGKDDFMYLMNQFKKLPFANKILSRIGL